MLIIMHVEAIETLKRDAMDGRGVLTYEEERMSRQEATSRRCELDDLMESWPRGGNGSWP